LICILIILFKHAIYCVNYDKEGIIQNPYTSSNSTYLDIDLSRCNNEVQQCGENYESIVSESYFILYYLSSYVSSKDYHEPVKYYYDQVAFHMTDKFLKRNYIKVGLNSYFSDNGWIFESLKVYDFYSISSMSLSMNGFLRTIL